MRPAKGINPGAELKKIERAIKRLEAVLADHSLIMGDPPEELDLDLWTDRADNLAHRLSCIYEDRRDVLLMRHADDDRRAKGLPSLYDDVPGVKPISGGVIR